LDVKYFFAVCCVSPEIIPYHMMEWKKAKYTNFKVSVSMSDVIVLIAKRAELSLGMMY
jgi:hypothetical protein